MQELVDLHMEGRRLEMFQFGVAVNAAMSDDPRKNLDRILHPLDFDLDKVHPMIRGSIGT
jgi:hypothetical protein